MHRHSFLLWVEHLGQLSLEMRRVFNVVKSSLYINVKNGKCGLSKMFCQEFSSHAVPTSFPQIFCRSTVFRMWTGHVLHYIHTLKCLNKRIHSMSGVKSALPLLLLNRQSHQLVSSLSIVRVQVLIVHQSADRPPQRQWDTLWMRLAGGGGVRRLGGGAATQETLSALGFFSHGGSSKRPPTPWKSTLNTGLEFTHSNYP